MELLHLYRQNVRQSNGNGMANGDSSLLADWQRLACKNGCKTLLPLNGMVIEIVVFRLPPHLMIICGCQSLATFGQSSVCELQTTKCCVRTTREVPPCSTFSFCHLCRHHCNVLLYTAPLFNRDVKPNNFFSVSDMPPYACHSLPEDKKSEMMTKPPSVEFFLRQQTAGSSSRQTQCCSFQFFTPTGASHHRWYCTASTVNPNALTGISSIHTDIVGI